MKGPETIASNTGPIRALVIDDDRKLCRLIKTYLEPLGYAVSAAHTGPGLAVGAGVAFIGGAP